jgi:hypothetical protein
MVRSAAYRASKYDSKMVGDVVKNRIDAQRDSMVAQETTQFSNLAQVESDTKQLCETWGINVILVPSMLAFARQCYKITKKHSGDIAHDEICLREVDWETRLAAAGMSAGTAAFYLATISEDVFSVSIDDCT